MENLPPDRLALVLLIGLLVPVSALAQQPELGHKTLGTLGLDAGTQAKPGVYVSDRFIWYSAHDVRDRNGQSLPVGLNLDAVGNLVGLSAVFKLPFSTYYSASVGAPLSSIRSSTDAPETSIDKFGLGDAYLQPARLGWRLAQVDIVTGYAVYIPTGHFEPVGGKGVGKGQWTHELSAGGTVFFDPDHTWSLSALGSLELNTKKREIDITRGDTIQIQGGVGKTFSQFFQPGLTFYALSQISADTGADLPPVLRNAWDRAFGLGAQVNLLIAPIRGKLTLGYSHDVVVRSRTFGQLLLVGLSINVWKP